MSIFWSFWYHKKEFEMNMSRFLSQGPQIGIDHMNTSQSYLDMSDSFFSPYLMRFVVTWVSYITQSVEKIGKPKTLRSPSYYTRATKSRLISGGPQK